MLCSDVVKEKWHRGRELRGAETTLFWVKSSEKALKTMLHLRRLTLNQAVDSKEKMGEQTNSKVRKSPVLEAYRRGLEGEEKERMERALKNLLYFIILIFWGISYMSTTLISLLLHIINIPVSWMSPLLFLNFVTFPLIYI